MTVGEYTSKVTHREHQAWLRYLAKDQNEPGKTEWYLMQIAAEVHHIFNKQKKLEEYKLKFAEPTKAPTVAELKAGWFALLGIDPNNPESINQNRNRNHNGLPQ